LLAFEDTHPPELFLAASACSFLRLSVYHSFLISSSTAYLHPTRATLSHLTLSLLRVNPSYSFLCSCWFSLGSFTRLYVNQNFYLWLILLATCFLQVTCLAYSLTLKMEVARSSETSVKYRTTWCHIAEDNSVCTFSMLPVHIRNNFFLH
jgi:hypothetical protein